MNFEESRGCLERAEASLGEAAEQLVRFPLDPARACASLARARLALETLRNPGQPGNRELAGACRRAWREAARVQRLLDGAAQFSFRCFAAAAVGPDSYTPAGELQSAAQAEHLVFQG